jgi:O-antigen/teichoic acid export membrane protein
LKLSALFRHSFWYLIGNVARRAVGFLLIPFYTSYLSPADYGLIEIIELFVSVSTIAFGILAIGESMIRIYHDQADPAGRNGVVSTAILSVAGVSLLPAAAAFVFGDVFSRWMFGDARYGSMIRAAFAAMVLSNVSEVALIYFRICQRAALVVVFSLAQLTLSVLLNIYFIAFAGLGVWGFIWSKVISTGIGAAALIAVASAAVSWRFHREYAQKIREFGAPLVLTGISFFVIHFSDRFFLNQAATLAEVGIYSLAYKFGFLVTFLVGEPFGNVWGVSLYARTAQPNWRDEFARVFGILAFCLVLAGLALAILIGEVLPIVAGAAFGGAAALVPLVALGYVLREMGDFFRGVLFINKRSGLFSQIVTACGFLNLILNLVLIPPFHALGAAFATALTWLAYVCACWLLACREHPIPVRSSALALLAAGGFAAYGVSTFTNGLPLPWQWFLDVAILLTLAVLAWVGGYFPAQDRAAAVLYAQRGWKRLFSTAGLGDGDPSAGS